MGNSFFACLPLKAPSESFFNQTYHLKNLRVFRVPPPPGPYIDWEEGRGREETKDGRNNRETRDGRELAPEYRDGPPSKRR